jgi:predicted short-subunit dehydrogenase-like oxidoreductase (DUF2520 family)
VIRVAVVGPGRVGTALALALPRPPYEVVAVTGRGEAGVRALVRRLPSARSVVGPLATRTANLVILSVPDDALEQLVRQLAGGGGVAEGSRWVHTAGGHGLAALRPARLAGAAVAACHPAQTFPDRESGVRVLPGTTWAVTAAEADLAWARSLVTDLGGTPVLVPEQARTLYHAGLVVGANGASTVVALARELLLGAGITDPAAFLRPLVVNAVANATVQGAVALTGPVRRGDAGTVARHLAELERVMPEVTEVYRVLARLALRHAARAGLHPAAAQAVERALGDGGDPHGSPP